MKKFRGKRRYFRNLWRETKVNNYDLKIEKDSWFDLWHTHLDFYGYGNNNLKIRKEHMKANIALYKDFQETLQELEMPYQLWIEIVEEDASLDAIYLHTSNPNQNNFPFKIDNVNRNCTIPTYLNGVINLNEFNVGQYKSESSTIYLIQKKLLEKREESI